MSVLKYVIAVVLSLLLLSCAQKEEKEVFRADFTKINHEAEEFDAEIGVWGGSGKFKIQPIESEGSSFKINNTQLKVSFSQNGKLAFHPSVLGLPVHWPRAHQLRLEIENTSKSAIITVEIFGSRSRISKEFQLHKGENTIELDIRNVPLLGGLESEILKIQFLSKHDADLVLNDISLEMTDEKLELVDQWGQLKLNKYEYKISSLQELKMSNEDILHTYSKAYETDDYGGYVVKGLSFPKSKFFYVHQRKGNWSLVTPDGNPFYSLGLNGVRRKSTLNNAALTRVKGREWLFQDLPDINDCPECYSKDTAYVSFYHWNVKRKYASYSEWKQNTKTRMQSVGFNTVGNWSDTLMMTTNIPYTFTLDTRKGTGLSAGHRLPDVFHPEYEQRLRASFKSIELIKDDPYLIGYFVDNEMHWNGINDLDPSSASYAYLLNYPKDEWQDIFAERYFSLVKNTIKTYDKNHLYLGCRFTRNYEPIKDVVRVAGKYLDVLSLNIYSMFTEDEITNWYKLLQKPILIGEHHVPPDTKRALLPRYKAFHQKERDSMLAHYLETWSKFPFAIGSHWYQYVDQEVSGRSDAGENQPVGLVSITDKLDTNLATKFHNLSKKIYDNYVNRLR